MMGIRTRIRVEQRINVLTEVLRDWEVDTETDPYLCVPEIDNNRPKKPEKQQKPPSRSGVRVDQSETDLF